MGDSSFVVILCVAVLAGVVVGQVTALMFFTAVFATTSRRTVQLLRQSQALANVRNLPDEVKPPPIKFGPTGRHPTGKLIQQWHQTYSSDQPTQPNPIVGKNGRHPS
jgi:hypothetical protein